MALSDKNIIIIPNNGQIDDPKIDFIADDGTNGPYTITLTVTTDNNGTLSFSGTNGQLFAISDSMTGSIFSVNDISGIPSIEVFDTGEIRLAEFSGNVGIGLANPTNKLHIQTSDFYPLKLSSTNNGVGIQWELNGTVEWQTFANSTEFVFNDGTNNVITLKQGSGADALYLNSTGLGINTNNPQERLHVNGNSIIDGTLTVNNTQSIIDNSQNRHQLTIQYNTTAGGDWGGIKFTHDWYSTGYLAEITAEDVSGGKSKLHFRTNQTGGTTSIPSDALTLDENGDATFYNNVNVTNDLTVNGNVTVKGENVVTEPDPRLSKEYHENIVTDSRSVKIGAGFIDKDASIFQDAYFVSRGTLALVVKPMEDTTHYLWDTGRQRACNGTYDARILQGGTLEFWFDEPGCIYTKLISLQIPNYDPNNYYKIVFRWGHNATGITGVATDYTFTARGNTANFAVDVYEIGSTYSEYSKGTLIASGDATYTLTTTSFPATDNIAIGCRDTGTDISNAIFKDVVIYNDILTDSEIDSLYANITRNWDETRIIWYAADLSKRGKRLYSPYEITTNSNFDIWDIANSMPDGWYSEGTITGNITREDLGGGDIAMGVSIAAGNYIRIYPTTVTEYINNAPFLIKYSITKDASADGYIKIGLINYSKAQHIYNVYPADIHTAGVFQTFYAGGWEDNLLVTNELPRVLRAYNANGKYTIASIQIFKFQEKDIRLGAFNLSVDGNVEVKGDIETGANLIVNNSATFYSGIAVQGNIDTTTLSISGTDVYTIFANKTHTHTEADITDLQNYALATHNHDSSYLKLTGGTISSDLTVSGKLYCDDVDYGTIRHWAQPGTLPDTLYMTHDSYGNVEFNFSSGKIQIRKPSGTVELAGMGVTLNASTITTQGQTVFNGDVDVNYDLTVAAGAKVTYGQYDIGDVGTSFTMDGTNGMMQYARCTTVGARSVTLQNLSPGTYILEIENDATSDVTVSFVAGTGVDAVNLQYGDTNEVIPTGKKGIFNIIASKMLNGTTQTNVRCYVTYTYFNQ